MTFDSEEHRTIVLQLINTAQFAGSAAEKVVELKAAVMAATIAEIVRELKEAGK